MSGNIIMKKLLALIIALLVLITLVACGDGGGQSNPLANNDNATTSDVSETPDTPEITDDPPTGQTDEIRDVVLTIYVS